MEPEKKMLLAAVLLAVAQQDAKNVKYLGVKPSRMQRISEAIAAEARVWVASESFAAMCEQIDVDWQAMRALEPDAALDAFNKLMEQQR